MLVKEIIDKKHPFIYEDELATKARATIRNFALRILPVTNENVKLLGIISRGDVMVISSSISPIRVKGIMRYPKYTATMEEDTFSAVRGMIRQDEWYAPVVNSAKDKTYKGILGLENFIDAILKMSPEKLSKATGEIMSKNVVTCSPEDEIDNIWRLMQTKAFTGLPVVKKDTLVGIITQKDLLESGALLPTFESKKGRFRAPTKISSIMKKQVIAVKSKIKVIRVAKIMISKDIGRVPIIDEKSRLIGIVDREDVARLLVK